MRAAGALPRAPGGVVSSRSWGHGGVVWSPGKVQAKVNVPGYQAGPAERNLVVSTKRVDASGRLKTLTLPLIVEGGVTGLQLKELLAKHDSMPNAGAPLAPDRMSITIYGAELADDSPLSSLAPTAVEVQARLQIRRRGAPVPTTVVADADARAPPSPESPPRHKPVAAAAEDATGGAASSAQLLPPRSLVLRCNLSGAKAVEVPTSGDMDVSTLRAVVSKLPMALSAWKGEDAAAAGDKKAPAKDAKAQADSGEDV